MNNLGLIFLSISIALIGVLGFFVSNKFYSAYSKNIENKARYECAQSARVEVNESETIKGYYPEKSAYEDCLDEKGLK